VLKTLFRLFSSLALQADYHQAFQRLSIVRILFQHLAEQALRLWYLLPGIEALGPTEFFF
jgi:hypothetical protein